MIKTGKHIFQFQKHKLVAGVCCLLTLLACNKNDWNANSPKPVAFETPQGWPATVYNFEQNPLTEQGIALGRKLFYDGRLSKDGHFPCSSCHQQPAAFGTMAHDRSHGYNNSHTLRNALPLQNLAWVPAFYWDGAVANLDEVAAIEISHPLQMAENINDVLAKLNADAHYPSLFKAAFGSSQITAKRMAQALSQFMLTMVSAGSKYDLVQQGKASFNLPESLGYEIFKTKCANCHAEPLFTDFSYRNTGMPLDVLLNDKGRMNITHLAADSLKFRVPTLRNIMVSDYYGHDGRFFDVSQVMEHYNSGVVNGPTTDPLVKNKIPLSNFEKGQLLAFLTTLTDSAFLTDKQLAGQ